MSLLSEIDVAIIGGGAAGIAAARALENANLSMIILEARDRLGGRAHTVTLPNDIHFDVGCGWLHSANENAFVSVAETLSFEIDRERPPWRRQSYDKGFPRHEREDFIKAIDEFYDRAETGADELDKRGADAAAATFLESGNRWNPMINAISSYINGAELDRVSAVDLNSYEDTEENWRIQRGYGTMIAAYGSLCPISLNTKVTLIDHSSARVKIETSRGTLSAKKVIVTVPTNLLANETIRFHPPLPAKVDAAAGLPLGFANKVMLALDPDNDLPDGVNLRGGTSSTKIGTYHLRPFGQNCIEGYFGGTFARELEDAGEGAFAQQAISEIVAIMGSDFQKKLKPLAESRWVYDPLATGSYSHALPGHAGDRAILAAPVDDKLFFAGEATHPHFFSTAHGAFESGVRAAKEVMKVAA
jgi:monoamine oxidase